MIPTNHSPGMKPLSKTDFYTIMVENRKCCGDMFIEHFTVPWSFVILNFLDCMYYFTITTTIQDILFSVVVVVDLFIVTCVYSETLC